MNSHPILFSPAMRRAILAGTKSQTRRVVKPQPDQYHIPAGEGSGGPYWFIGGYRLRPTASNPLDCPYGSVGAFLWVKETHWRLGKWVKDGLTKTGGQRWRFAATKGEYVRFRAPDIKPAREEHGWHKRPSIFMPRSLSRITLEITQVRVQRLHEITESDAKAEGVPLPGQELNAGGMSAGRHYEYLWEDINGKRPGCAWSDNPWIWAISFRLVGDIKT